MYHAEVFKSSPKWVNFHPNGLNVISHAEDKYSCPKREGEARVIACIEGQVFNFEHLSRVDFGSWPEISQRQLTGFTRLRGS